jgi:hypothetical protein
VSSSLTYAQRGHDIVLHMPGLGCLQEVQPVEFRDFQLHIGGEMDLRRCGGSLNFEKVKAQGGREFWDFVEARIVVQQTLGRRIDGIRVEDGGQSEGSYLLTCSRCIKTQKGI